MYIVQVSADGSDQQLSFSSDNEDSEQFRSGWILQPTKKSWLKVA